MNTAKLSFFDIFDARRVAKIAWTTIAPGETSDEKHLWLYNRRDASPGAPATRIRVTAVGLTSSGDAVCVGKFIEVRSDGIKGEPDVPFDDDAQAEFTPVGGSLLDDGAYLEIGDIPPLCARRLIFRLNIPESFDLCGPAVIHLLAGYREES
jgi:hypothetical protein